MKWIFRMSLKFIYLFHKLNKKEIEKKIQLKFFKKKNGNSLNFKGPLKNKIGYSKFP